MTYAASWPACSRHPHGTLNSAFPASPYILHPHAHSIRRLCVNSHSQLSEKYAPVLPRTQAPAVHQGSTVPVQQNSKDETCLGNDQVKLIRHRALFEENFYSHDQHTAQWLQHRVCMLDYAIPITTLMRQCLPKHGFYEEDCYTVPWGVGEGMNSTKIVMFYQLSYNGIRCMDITNATGKIRVSTKRLDTRVSINELHTKKTILTRGRFFNNPHSGINVVIRMWHFMAIYRLGRLCRLP